MTRTKRIFFAMFLALATTFGFNPEVEAADATINFNVEYDISACGWGAEDVTYTSIELKNNHYHIHGVLDFGNFTFNWTNIVPSNQVTPVAGGFEINDGQLSSFPFPCI